MDNRISSAQSTKLSQICIAQFWRSGVVTKKPCINDYKYLCDDFRSIFYVKYDPFLVNKIIPGLYNPLIRVAQPALPREKKMFHSI